MATILPKGLAFTLSQHGKVAIEHDEEALGRCGLICVKHLVGATEDQRPIVLAQVVVERLRQPREDQVIELDLAAGQLRIALTTDLLLLPQLDIVDHDAVKLLQLHFFA